MVPAQPIPSDLDSQYPVVIPCYSTWFSFDSIHANERKSLHELFSAGEGSESLYMVHRSIKSSTCTDFFRLATAKFHRARIQSESQSTFDCNRLS